MPDSPERGRWWRIIEEYGVTIFYTAPTAIRSFMKQGQEVPDRSDMSSLRILGSVGEPINPEAYVWYRHVIGGDRTPVVDTWWQTETGAIMISPLPGVTHGKPGSAMIPIPGVSADVVTEEGESVPNGSGGYLVLTEPWPSMLRTIWGDDDRFRDTYWSRYDKQGWYFAGDGAKKDDDGDLWVLGRVDDVMNVSGHRLSTTEIESALVSHPKVAEAAVVGAKDEDTGQAVCAFVILREEAGDGGEDIVEELRNHVRKEIGADRQAAPDHDRPRAAEDPLGQDHAPAAPGRRRAPRGRRRDHPRRQLGDGPDLGGDRQGQGGRADSDLSPVRREVWSAYVADPGGRDPSQQASLFSRGTFPEASAGRGDPAVRRRRWPAAHAGRGPRAGLGQQPVVRGLLRPA